VCGLLALLEDVEDREARCSELVLEVRVLGGRGEDSLRQELWVERSGILRGEVEEGSDSVALRPALSLVDLVGAVAVWVERLVVSDVVYVVVEVEVAREVIIGFHLEGTCRVRKVAENL
jgi:hypothetical protein